MKSDAILLIDDEPHILSAIKRDIRKWVKKNEVTVYTHHSADEAYSFLKQQEVSPAIVICDQRMPGMSGIDFFRRLAITHPDTVTIMLTGHGGELDFPEIVSVGIFSFVNKPWDSNELRGEVMKAYQVYSLRRSNRDYSLQLKQELFLATEFQKNIMKFNIPRSDAFKIGISSIFARGNDLTGDYMDIVPLSEDRIVILLGDVAGHGLNAAFLTAILKSIIYPEYFRDHSFDHFSPSAFLGWLNRRLGSLQLDDHGLFIAFCACYLDISNSTVEIANAGQPKPIHVSSTGIQTLNENNLVLGILREASFDGITIHIKAGDRIILMTDGYNLSGFRNADYERIDLYRKIFDIKDNPEFHKDLLHLLEDNAGDHLGEDDGTLITISFT